MYLLLKTKNISRYAAKILDQKEKVCYNIYIKIRKGNDFMGLDNGIQFKILDKQKFGDIPKWFKREDWEDKHNFDYEVLYWRKCWNVRAVILSYLEASDDEYHWTLSLMDLKDICKLLKKLYTKANWDEMHSIWSWDEIKKIYPSNLRYARKVLKWLETKPEGSYELYFYDSY